jgi:hypothetical protein
MASRRTQTVAALALLATVATSGCLATEFIKEPWVWRDVDQASDDFSSPDYSNEESLDLADRTNRVRIRFNVTLENDQQDPLTSSLQEGPGLNLTVKVPGSGATYQYFFDESDSLRDLYPRSGDGELDVTIQARGQGSWDLAVEAYEPEYEDWRWYAIWDR